MLFFLYCFVHEAFDQPRPTQGAMIPHIQSLAERVRAIQALTPTLDRCQRLLDRPGYVIFLPPFVPFVRQIARPDRGLNLSALAPRERA